MCKMITYWKSNARKEFGFYGQGKNKISDDKLNGKVIEALAEFDEMDEEEEEVQYQRRMTSGEVIPNNNVIVLIEKLWIEQDIDLKNKSILEYIDKISEDDDSIIEEDLVKNDDNDINTEKGVLDYNIEDLVNEYTS